MKQWQKIGLGWGVWMFLCMAFIWPLIDGEKITLNRIFVKFIFLMLSGFIFGYVSSKYKKYKGN